MNSALKEGRTVVICPQVVYELRVVLTRPRIENGYGYSALQFESALEQLTLGARLIPDPSDLVQRWLDVCEAHGIVGKRSHDARLVAWMLAHKVDTLLTLNPRDFAAFPIDVRTP